MSQPNSMQIIMDMHNDDCNGTSQFVKLSPYFVRGQLTKKGAEVTMGIDQQTFMNIDNEKVILLCVDKAEFNRRFKEQEAQNAG